MSLHFPEHKTGARSIYITQLFAISVFMKLFRSSSRLVNHYTNEPAEVSVGERGAEVGCLSLEGKNKVLVDFVMESEAEPHVGESSRVHPAVLSLMLAAAASSDGAGQEAAAGPRSSRAEAPDLLAPSNHSQEAATAAGTAGTSRAGGPGAGDGEAVISGISYSRWDNLEVSSDDDQPLIAPAGSGVPGVVAGDVLRIFNGARVRIQNLGRHVCYNGQVSKCTHTLQYQTKKDKREECCDMRSLSLI